MLRMSETHVWRRYVAPSATVKFSTRLRGGGAPSELHACGRGVARDPGRGQPGGQGAGGLSGRLSVPAAAAQVGADYRGQGAAEGSDRGAGPHRAGGGEG